VKSNVTVMNWLSGFRLGFWFLRMPLGMCAVLVAANLAVRSPREALASFSIVALVISWMFQTVLSSKLGAVANYFLEPSCWAVIVIVQHGLIPLAEVNAKRTMLALAMMSLLVSVTPVFELVSLPANWRQPPEQYEHVQAAVAELNIQPGEALADERLTDTLNWSDIRPLVNDPFAYSQRVNNGATNPKGLVQSLESQQVRLLVMYRSLDQKLRPWPEPIAEAMRKNYVLWKSWPGLYLYRARDDAAKNP
jgi:hypothetical protein